MKVSVALCTYNGERYIRQQLESIFCQTRLPDEIIVCDDGSRDNTLAILGEYVDRGADVRIHSNERNLGFVKNFKQCISLCSGEIIFLCDQDDIWEQTKVEELHALMEAEPKILSLCTNFWLVDCDGQRLTREPVGDNPFFNKMPWEIDWQEKQLCRIKLSAILSHNIGPGCTQVIRRSILEEYLGWDSREPHDYNLNRLAALHHGLYYYDKALTCYRVHEKQTLGVPTYPVARSQKAYGVMAENIFDVFRVFAYHVILRQYDKVGEPVIFEYSDVIAFFDAQEMDDGLKEEYRFWREMAVNRTALYTPGQGSWKCFLKQGKYNKYFAYNYGWFERLQMRFRDLTVLLLLRAK